MRKRPAVTIKDVAAAAGVTPMTVSNVINEKPGTVGPAARARVLKAIERLGYRPDAVARRLRTKRFGAIGVLILDDTPQYLNDPFTTNVVAGLGNFATEHGYSLVLQGIRSSTVDSAVLLSRLETDGVCAMLAGSPAERRKLVAKIAGNHQPLVLIQDKSMPGDICAVRQDDRDGAAMIARHAIAKGARRLYMLVPSLEWPAMVEREAGIRAVAAAARAELVVVRCGDEGMDATQTALLTTITEKGLPDAILGGNDRMAIAALKLLSARGIAVPGKVLVTGFNGFEAARYTTPTLTTVHSPAYDIGRRAGAEILARIETGAFTAKDVVLPVAIEYGQTA